MEQTDNRVTLATRWLVLLTATALVGACGGGGGGGTTPPVNRAPTADAGVDTLVLKNTTVTLSGAGSSDPDGSIASYAWTQTAGPVVTLSGAGSVSASFVAPDVVNDTDLSFQLIVTDNQGLASAPDTVVITVTAVIPATVTLTGKITFDLVPRSSATGGLDYANTQVTPAAGIRVQAINASNGTTVLAAADTNNNGNYSLTVPAQTSIFVRARAEMVRTGAPDWDFTVVDNNGVTSPATQPVYALVSTNFNSGVANQVVNLHAASGWDGSAYTQTRAAAPFSILYAVKKALDLVLQADPIASFPALKLNWSPNNSVAAVSTSYYDGTEIYLLGKANEDTEEFDHAVIVHEWGHYFEDVFSRSDSIGGSHVGGDVLDARVAFSEGWGNAFQSMARGDALYFDTSGASQSSGFSFSLESNCDNPGSSGPRGWFNECSVQSLLYDLFDPVNQAESSGDNVNLGFGPILDVLVADQRLTQSLTTIHSFSKFLRDQNPGSQAGIDGLLNYHSIVSGAGIDQWGTGESNDAGSRTAGLDPAVVILPIYKVGLTVGVPKNVCVDVDSTEGNFNKLGNRQFIRFTVPSTGNYQITATTTSSPPGDPLASPPVPAPTPDPDMVLYNHGPTHYAFDGPNPVETFCSTTAGTFDFGSCNGGLLPLQAGVDYVLEVQDDNDLSYDTPDGDPDPAHVGLYCMDIELTAP